MTQHYRAPVKLTDEAVRKLSRWQFIALLLIIVVTILTATDFWTLHDLDGAALAMQIAAGPVSGVLLPTMTGVPAVNTNPLTAWSAALVLKLIGPGGLVHLVSAITAMRITAALWFLAAMGTLWVAARAFARRNAVKPLTFAFGGEASPTDYSRAVADISVLLLMATCGLLARRHEAASDAALLWAGAFNLLALARSLENPRRGAVLAGAATAFTFFAGNLYLALATFAADLFCFARVRAFGGNRKERSQTLVVSALGISILWPLLSFAFAGPETASTWWAAWLPAAFAGIGWAGLEPLAWVFKNGVWYLFPLWPLVVLAIVRWHRQRREAELRILLISVLMPFFTAFFSGNGNPNLVFLGFLPPMSLFAAFGLVTMRGRHRSIIDWFFLAVSTMAVLIGWSYWAAWLLGTPPKMWQSMMLLAPASHPVIDAGLYLAVVASILWLALFIWRFTHRPAFVWSGAWLAATGTTAVFAVWIGLFHSAADVNRSYEPVAHSVKVVYTALGGTPGGCIETQGVPLGLAGYLEVKTGIRMTDREGACPIRLLRLDKRGAKPVLPEHSAGPIARPHTNEYFYLVADDE